jgi:predicted DNA-binding transcriptional regulator AlpA
LQEEKTVQETTPIDRLLTASQVADILAIGIRTLWRKVATGELPPPAWRPNCRIVRWKESQITQFIETIDQPRLPPPLRRAI